MCLFASVSSCCCCNGPNEQHQRNHPVALRTLALICFTHHVLTLCTPHSMKTYTSITFTIILLQTVPFTEYEAWYESRKQGDPPPKSISMSNQNQITYQSAEQKAKKKNIDCLLQTPHGCLSKPFGNWNTDGV